MVRVSRACQFHLTAQRVLFFQLFCKFFERLFGQFARSDICHEFILDIAKAVFQKLEFGESLPDQ